MSWLAISGMDLSAIIAATEEPKGDRRDIGDVSDADDGSKRATRTTRKYDFSGRSIPLSKEDAFAWESLITGAGNVWSFDASYYSSKGIPIVPSDPADTSIFTSIKKFGAASLRVNSIGELFTTSGLGLDGTRGWTMAAWLRMGAGTFHHYVRRANPAGTWVDGVRNDAAADPFGVSGGEASFDPTPIGSAIYYADDFVVCPYAWPDAWAPLVFANNAAFSPLPYLTCSGDLVPEAATRKMIGKATIAGFVRAGASKTMQKLQVDLLGA